MQFLTYDLIVLNTVFKLISFLKLIFHVMDVCTFVKVTNIINHASFGNCMFRGLLSAKGRIQAFPIGS
jgi:hypothetical protein